MSMLPELIDDNEEGDNDGAGGDNGDNDDDDSDGSWKAILATGGVYTFDLAVVGLIRCKLFSKHRACK